MTAGMRLLVKANSAIAGTQLTLDKRQYDAQPLFSSIGVSTNIGAVPSPTWHILTTADSGGNPWDICHAMAAEGLGLAGSDVEFAEPDIQQRWLYGDEKLLGLALAGGCGAPSPERQDYPHKADNFWLRGRDFSQFDAAAAKVGVPASGKRTRIAHFDTGYDPAHLSLPAHMNTVLERNFVDPGLPNSAVDTVSGALTNPGHGTGTLGILGGKPFGSIAALGGAPEAEIVAVRVANSVVLFYNSAIAQALDYVHGLCANPETFVHVVTMSMGGLASQAWAEAVNAIYERGVFIVSAAGNNYANLPTHNIVFPARFNRVIAACGVMADHTAYADLAPTKMAGNYGPQSKMETAMAACTPNTPWARKGCPNIVDFDGNGTSSATPQIAAAAALWTQFYASKLAAYPQNWMRAEAVRQAILQSAGANPDKARLGRGELRSLAMLDLAPAAAAELEKAPVDSARFPILDTLTGAGFGAAGQDSRRMLELEALQLSQSTSVEAVLPDPNTNPNNLTLKDRLNIIDALLAQPGISQKLRGTLEASRGMTSVSGGTAPVTRPGNAAERFRMKLAMNPEVAAPTRRRLRVFAFDPSLATDPDTVAINAAVMDVVWEKELLPGPVGEYLEVVDVDPASRSVYPPIDLNHPHLLPQDGLAPSEGDPQFHQQMVYAVAMRTIEFFEQALGRTALWAPRPMKGRPDEYVQRLRIYPHAIRTANAFYSPDRKALLLGYFTATGESAGLGLPHGVYFAALSHDVIAHETTHALLDGLHRRFREPTNPDVLAFHEAFADISALFQHFTMPEALKEQIRKTRGAIGASENLLGKLAVEFGQAMNGDYGALRDAIGTYDREANKWTPAVPSTSDYDPKKDAHALGSVLVSAVFAAFLSIFNARASDLVRLATNGTGVLPSGEIPNELADRLAAEASKVAGQILRMCIRALDYCPPVDITFGDYLRAVITADHDLVPADPRGYRAAFAAAFRDRGVYPSGVRHLSPDNLLWNRPSLPLRNLGSVLEQMDLAWTLDSARQDAYNLSLKNARIFHDWLVSPARVSTDELAALGLVRTSREITISGTNGSPDVQGTLGGIEVHSVRPAHRVGPEGQSQTDLVVEITQTLRPTSGFGEVYRGGCTLLINLKAKTVRYVITKKLTTPGRVAAQRAFREQMDQNLRAAYFAEPAAGNEPFAMLHGVL